MNARGRAWCWRAPWSRRLIATLGLAIGCGDPNDFFDDPSAGAGAGGSAVSAGKGGIGGLAGSGAAAGGSAGTSNAGTSNAGNSSAGGATGGAVGAGGGGGAVAAGGSDAAGTMSLPTAGSESGGAGEAGAASGGGSGQATGGDAGDAGDAGNDGAAGANRGGSAGEGAGRGGDAAAGEGGSGGEACQPTNEVCDGVSNDCDDSIDEDDACPAGCSARQRAGHLYLLCLVADEASRLNYAGAAAGCADAGAELGLGVALELARLESEPENEFVKTWIRASTSEAGMVWFGANDLDQENRWVWGDGGDALQFFTGSQQGGGSAVLGRFHDFASGRPNSSNETNEDCGALDSELDWQWNDLACGQARLGLICEQTE